jgi:hypothetical protein
MTAALSGCDDKRTATVDFATGAGKMKIALAERRFRLVG